VSDIHAALEGFKAQIDSFVAGLKLEDGSPLDIQVGIDWPSRDAFDHLTSNPRGCLICIVDMGAGSTQQRYLMGQRKRTVVYPTGISATLNKSVLPGLGTATCTMGYAIASTQVNANDAVGLAAHRDIKDEGAVAIGAQGQSLTVLALSLANSINDRDLLNTWMEATSAGPVVTIVSRIAESLKIEANVGNVADWTREISRSSSRGMVAVFSPSIAVRKVVGQVLELQLNILNQNYGFLVPNDHPVRVAVVNTRICRDDVLMDLYRQDFLFELDYVITKVDRAYSILVGIGNTAFE